METDVRLLQRRRPFFFIYLGLFQVELLLPLLDEGLDISEEIFDLPGHVSVLFIWIESSPLGGAAAAAERR